MWSLAKDAGSYFNFAILFRFLILSFKLQAVERQHSGEVLGFGGACRLPLIRVQITQSLLETLLSIMARVTS